ncbi:hypothetical protein GCM10010178_44240 [Lentzea flava]|uniref:Type I restriction modification DNA specificity domain-containing protein n=3 Tax=Lentzea flava TaxID=103732 RepID=A0ABQ2UNW6_9PSEU|nr:Restriction endonuclease S subunit [Lentzea flava]GGU46929.1 hypothetical protein GCM10010178_44240 [Lentzea flava]
MLEMKRTTIGALGRLFDGPHATPTRRSDGPYFLNIASLKSGRLDLSESDHVSEEDFVRWTRRVTPRAGDLLFSYETRLGEAALMPEGVTACLGRRMALLRPDRSVVDPRFLLYFYLSPSFQRAIATNTIHGATVPRIGLSTMPAWEIAIPSLSKQKAIADVLGALDDKIAANDQVAVTALSLADALFAASLQRDAGTPITIGELADRGVLAQGDGYRTKQAEHGQPGFRILRAGDIRDGRVVPEGTDFVSESYARQIGQKASRPNDIVMTTKGSVGRVAVVPPDLETVVYSPQICYFRVLSEDALDRGYLAAWFRSSDLQTQASQLMFKSDMAPYINLRDIRSLTVPVPSRTEQRKQGELQRSLLDIIHAAHSESRRLGRTRDELLPLLMSGKIRVREVEKIVEGVV